VVTLRSQLKTLTQQKLTPLRLTPLRLTPLLLLLLQTLLLRSNQESSTKNERNDRWTLRVQRFVVYDTDDDIEQV
jgi:hypothetical protein